MYDDVYNRGYSHYVAMKPALVSKTANGKLVWAFDNSMLDDPEMYAEAYIKGQSDAFADDIAQLGLS